MTPLKRSVNITFAIKGLYREIVKGIQFRDNEEEIEEFLQSNYKDICPKILKNQERLLIWMNYKPLFILTQGTGLLKRLMKFFLFGNQKD